MRKENGPMRAMLFVFIVGWLVDRATKLWVTAMIPLGQSVPWLPFLQWTHVRNHGVAFSLFSHHPIISRWVLVALTLMLLLFIGWAWRSANAAGHRWTAWGWTLVLSGGFGNWFDRAYHGYVVDFIDAFVNRWHWPAFNVADILICAGAIMVLLVYWLCPEERGESKAH